LDFFPSAFPARAARNAGFAFGYRSIRAQAVLRVYAPYEAGGHIGYRGFLRVGIDLDKHTLGAKMPTEFLSLQNL